MKQIIFRALSFLLDSVNYKLVSKNNFLEINLQKINKKKNKDYKLSIENFLDYLFSLKSQSKSQIFQDLFVDYVFKQKKSFFYCEVGAADGIKFSNTFFLEKQRRWKGILCEPSLHWREKIKKNRPNNILIFDPISNKSSERLFYENDNNFLSGLEPGTQKSTKSYKVNTITLNSIFLKYKVKNIDYLSIDVEGHEISVLQGLNFTRYRPKVISIEHNYIQKKKIHKILSALNYNLVFPCLSRFDSFYVCKDFFRKI